jgi:hypothetical protein
MKTVELSKTVAIAYKGENGQKVETETPVKVTMSLPETPEEWSAWILTQAKDSVPFTTFTSSIESVMASKTGYKVACHLLKPALEASDVPSEIDLVWAFTPVSGGRFGYRKASEEAETKADLLKAKLTQIEELVAEGMVDAKAGQSKIDALKADIKEQLEIATKNGVLADKQAEEAKATKEANKNKAVKPEVKDD